MSKSARIIIIGLVAIGFIVYAFNLNNALFWDDDDWIVNNPAVHALSWNNVSFLFSHDILAGIGQSSNYYRPFLSLTFAFNWFLGGEAPFGYHLVSNLFHIGSAVLVFLLLSILLRSVRTDFRAATAAAAVAALFWLIHPLNTEAVAYISGRGDSLSVFFIFAALLAWLIGDGHWHRYEPTRPSLWRTGSWVAAACAMLSRETAVLLPGYIMLIGMAFLHRERLGRSLARSFKDAWPFIAISALYGTLRLTFLNFENTLNWHRHASVYSESVMVRVWTFLGALWEYLRLTFVPTGLHMERNVDVLNSPFAWPVPLMLTLLAVLVWQIIHAWRQGNRLWFFGACWFFLALAPASGIAVPINALIYEHWMYMPLVGVAALVGFYAVYAYGRIRRLSRALFVILSVAAILYGGFFALQTVRRNIIWGDTERFYLQILDYRPASVRVLNNLANWYADRGDVGRAEEYWTKAVEANPEQPAPYHNLGNLARDRGEYEKAENLYLLAISRDERFHYSYRNLVVMYLEQKRFEEAQKLLVVLTQLVPTDASIYFVLAQLYDAAGRGDLALEVLNVGAPYVNTAEQAASYDGLLKKLQAQ